MSIFPLLLIVMHSYPALKFPNVHYIHSLYIILLLTKYSGQKEKTKEALLLLDKQIEEFFRLYHVG